ncbi:MAG: hypothetical protein FJ311_10060 [Rhodospirillales bacterium]|nr:hypothetical protein [Rhodospirillales bacterium]
MQDDDLFAQFLSGDLSEGELKASSDVNEIVANNNAINVEPTADFYDKLWAAIYSQSPWLNCLIRNPEIFASHPLIKRLAKRNSISTDEIVCNLIQAEIRRFKVSELLDDLAVKKLNETCAAINDEGRFFVAIQKNEEIVLASQQDAARFFATHRHFIDGEPVKHFSLWMVSPHRKEYDGIVFEPGKDRVVKNKLNIWKGWPVQPIKGDIDPWLDHVENVVANGDKKIADSFHDFCAHLVQKPNEKPTFAVVLLGGKGAGKSLVGQVLGRIVGKDHYLSISQSARLIGKFDAQLGNALLIQAEEAFWAGDKAGEGVLKDLITAPSRNIEAKFRQPRQSPSYSRLFITSNESWVVPASIGERRFLVCRVSDERVGDSAYFRKLADWMNSEGGLSALMHWLLNRDISKFNPFEAPVITSDLIEQIIASFSPIQRFFFEVLKEGRNTYEIRESFLGTSLSTIVLDFRNGLTVSCQEIFSAYRHWERANSKSHPKSQHEFGRFVKVDLGCYRVKAKPDHNPYQCDTANSNSAGNQSNNSSGIVNCYRFPRLSDVRKQFEKNVLGRAYDWEEVSPDLGNTQYIDKRAVNSG